MPLRRRLTIALTAAVAVVVALACVAAYLAVRDELMSQIDDQLTDAGGDAAAGRSFRFGAAAGAARWSDAVHPARRLRRHGRDVRL